MSPEVAKNLLVEGSLNPLGYLRIDEKNLLEAAGTVFVMSEGMKVMSLIRLAFMKS